jgi:hypothetical protein
MSAGERRLARGRNGPYPDAYPIAWRREPREAHARPSAASAFPRHNGPPRDRRYPRVSPRRGAPWRRSRKYLRSRGKAPRSGGIAWVGLEADPRLPSGGGTARQSFKFRRGRAGTRRRLQGPSRGERRGPRPRA